MPAARFTSDVQINIIGDKRAGAKYIPEARKLLGYVLQDASVNNLGTHVARRKLEDGAQIIAEKFVDLNRITIIPPPAGKRKRPIRLFEDLYVSNGANGYDGSQERIYPPVILHPTLDDAEENVTSWKAFYFSSSAPGFHSGVGTYVDVFPKAKTALNEPNYLKKAQLITGNHAFWNEDGEYIHMQKVLPYWAPAYRHPDTIYGTGVVHLGMAMLSMQAYEDPDGAQLDLKQILGIGFRDGWLYVMNGDTGFLDYTPRPASASMMHDAWASPPFANTSADYALRRFRYKTVTVEATGMQHYVVINGSHEELWSGTLTRAYAPWVFSQDCTSVVSYQIPEALQLLYKAGEIEEPVSGPGLRFEISISIDDEADSASASFSSEGAGNRIAEEWGVTMRLVKIGPYTWEYQWGDGFSYPAYSWNGTSETINQIGFFDLRTNRGIFSERTHSYVGDVINRTGRAVAWENGTVTQFATGSIPIDFSSETTRAMYQKIRDDVNTAALEGLPMAYTRISGVVISAEVPEDGEDEPSAASLDYALLCHFIQDATVDGVAGVSNGGMSVSMDNDEEATSWEWELTVGFGVGGSFAPQHPGILTVFYVTFGAISAPHWLFYSDDGNFIGTSTVANYLTAGDLATLVDGAFPQDAIYDQGILGVPPITQPKERD